MNIAIKRGIKLGEQCQLFPQFNVDYWSSTFLYSDINYPWSCGINSGDVSQAYKNNQFCIRNFNKL